MATVICENCGAHIQLPEHSSACIGTTISRESEGIFILPTETTETFDVIELVDKVYIGMEDVSVTYRERNKFTEIPYSDVLDIVKSACKEWDNDPTVINERENGRGYYPSSHAAPTYLIISKSNTARYKRFSCFTNIRDCVCDDITYVDSSKNYEELVNKLNKHFKKENKTMTRNEERLESLKANGIDISKYFNVKLPSGGEVIMHMKNGYPVAVSDAELELRSKIIEDGYVRNSMLHRRFVMAQMFRMMNAKDGYDVELRKRGYMYQFEMTLEELRVQAKLYERDEDTFKDRNSFFNVKVANALADEYIVHLSNHLKKMSEKPKHCKGIPYITWKYRNIFVEDIDKKVIRQVRFIASAINRSKSPYELYKNFKTFVEYVKRNKLPYDTKQSNVWRDAYKGAGSYYTLRNMVQFHNCFIIDYISNEKYEGMDAVKYLENHIIQYKGSGFKFYAMLKKCIKDNNFKFTY